ncbi:MAG: sigma-54-dependent Fis family transcriptional regulator [Proteobacteria bacterium]|nr:sigma-54-dependent Fis family transcriptional regulator [Pseudomonadota bacterium]
MSATRVLVIEDTASMASLYVNYLQSIDFEADIAGEGKLGLAMLNKKPYQAVVLDLHLPDMEGLELLSQLRRAYEDMAIIIVTAHGSVDGAVEAIKLGAFDFIMKPFPAKRLQTTVQKALEHRKMQRELTELRREVYLENYQDFIGASPAMQAVFRQIEAVASSKANIFITGESGTGKELVARAIHRASPRAPKPFVALNCAAIPRELMESEIFGHVKGAFTGATQDRKGAASAADGGTLFLDEVCELPTELQAKILRFIQTGTFSPVGGQDQKSDIRILCATNRNVQREVEEGRFREDLYYRLYVIPIELPALRDREDDVITLANHFLKRFAAQEKKDFAGFEPEVLSLFLQYDWPGNVRQLENLIQQIVVMRDGPLVEAYMLPETMRGGRPQVHIEPVQGFTPFVVKPLWKIEKEAILKALKASHNDVPRAAALLEVNPSTIYRKLQAWKENGGGEAEVLSSNAI